MIFLDSDILSYFFGGNRLIYEKIKACIEENKKLVITCINYYEILKGLKYKKAELRCQTPNTTN